MSKKKDITISVKSPCHEKWGKMTPNSNGKHCSSCNKVVTDFTNYTDKELAAFIKNNPLGCGRFTEYQVNRPLILPIENGSSFLQRALLGTVLVAGITSVVNAQTIHQTIAPVQVPIPEPPSSMVSQHDKSQEADTSHIIKGTIRRSKTGIPLEYVFVIIEGTNLYAYTDSAGTFSIRVPDSLKKSKLKLAITKRGYHSASENIKAVNYPTNLQIALKKKHRRERVVMGAYF